MQYPIYELSEQFKIVRDIPKIASKKKKTIEEIAESEYQITRQAYYKYRRQVNKKLKEAGYLPKDLKTLSDDEIEKICREKEEYEEYEKTDPNKKVLNDLIEDINTVSEIEEPEEEIYETDYQEDYIEDEIENKSKFNINWKWLMIGGSVLLVGASIYFVWTSKKYMKKSNKKQEETKTDAVPADDIFSEFPIY